MRMRAAHRYENLSFCLRQSGWTWCISGEEILGTGPLSLIFLALLHPPFASSFLEDYKIVLKQAISLPKQIVASIITVITVHQRE